MGLSIHYTNERTKREKAIKEIGLGTIIYRATMLDTRRNKYYIYEVSTTAIMTIRPVDEPTLIITRFPARPQRIKQFWKNADEDIIKIAIQHTKMGLTF